MTEQKIVFKPLIESEVSIPKTFERLQITSIDDLEIQKNPGIWFTRNGASISYDSQTGSLKIGHIPISFLFRGSLEITTPRNYFINKRGVELTYRGRGWLSVKLIESTLTPGGVRTQFGGNWKKLDTVRESEILSWSSEWQTKQLNWDSFLNKPFNVSRQAFLKGFQKMNLEKIASLEITARVGILGIKQINFF